MKSNILAEPVTKNIKFSMIKKKHLKRTGLQGLSKLQELEQSQVGTHFLRFLLLYLSHLSVS